MVLPRIALFGNRDSQQVEAIRDAVLEVGGQPVVLDIQAGGDGAPSILMGSRQARWADVDFSDIHAIHIRCTSLNTPPAIPPLLNAVSQAEWRLKFLQEQHFLASTFSFFAYLVALGKLVINPLTAGYIDHDSKGQFYEKLRSNGYRVPATVTTNNPKTAEIFLETWGKAVVKPAMGVGSTRLVTAADRSRLHELIRSPVLMQERILGSTVRVHIVGDTVVLALRIISDGGVDSRTGSPKFEFIKLPEEEEQRMVQANRFLGLHYAAWDVIENSLGNLVYLDCNPGPYVMWIGQDMARGLFRQLAIYLLTFAKTGSLLEASAAVTPYLPTHP